MRWTTLIAGQHPTPTWRKALWYVAHNLSAMIGQEISVASHCVATLPLGELVAAAGDPEAAMIGVYLLLGDDLPGQAILLLSLADALAIVDRLLDVPPGTTTQL